MMKITANYKQSFTLLPIALALTFVPFGAEIGLAMLLVVSLGIFLIWRYSTDDATLALVLFLAFLSRAFVAVVDDKFSLLPYAWDDFFTAAIQIKDNVLTGYPIFYSIEKSIHLKSYSAFSSAFLFLFGDNEISIRLFNCLLGALVAERVYRICLLLNFKKRVAHFALVLTAFWPSFIIFSSLNMRDSLITFLSIDLLVRVLIVAHQRKLFTWLIIGCELLILIILRTQNIVVYTSVFGVYILYSYSSKGFIKGLLKPLPLIIIVSAVFIFYFTSQYFDGFLRYLNVEMKWRAVGGSAYLTGQSYASWFDVVKFAPLRFIYFCFGPFA